MNCHQRLEHLTIGALAGAQFTFSNRSMIPVLQ